MELAQKGQVRRSAADIYEEFFVPALFAGWTGQVAEAAGLSAGQKVLDVACGTGALAREALHRVQPQGAVVGLDCNEGMLDVARRICGDIDWQNGQAEALPFADHRFDAVVSQFGLMFFEDRAAAISEMWRVLRPGGRMAIAVWDRIEHAPGYTAMTQILERLFGDTVADALRAPYSLGNAHDVRWLFNKAGVADVDIDTEDGDAVFPSIAAWVHTDVKGWTLADLIDDGQYQVLLDTAELELTEFVQADGTVRFAHPAHIITACKS